MASTVEICNYALRLLGADTRISSLTEASREANVLSDLYDITRRAELRAHWWNFAAGRHSIAADADAPAFEYLKRYTLAPATLCVRYVWCGTGLWPRPIAFAGATAGDKRLYEVEGRAILTDLSAPLLVKTTEEATDPALFDALFTAALAAKLAMLAAPDIASSDRRAENAASVYARTIDMAKQRDAVENPPEQLPDTEWVTDRWA